MFGPLFILKYKGMLCPCLESSQERAARRSLQLLSNLPIQWLRDKESNMAESLVGKLFSSSPKKTGIPSVFTFIDGDNGPLLQVQPQPSNDENCSNGGPLQQSAGYIKTLSLYEVRDVELKHKTLSLTTRVGGKPKKLLQFTVIEHDSVSPQEVQEAFRMLLAWEQSAIPDEDREVEIDMNRAQKAAHFCQRELELKNLKREREKRKEKYLSMSRKNGGGMKYTAIAMANREDANIT